MAHPFNRIILGLTALLFGTLGASALELSDDPKEKGRQIADEAEARDLGFEDSHATMAMILTNAYGDRSERELRFKTLERPDPDEGDWSLIVFDRPRDVEGTALLTHAHILTPDDQWLYLPSLKRVKRISSANKSGPFMGSEFAFEDFSSTEAGKFDHLWLRDEACPVPDEDRMCFVSERRPLYEKSGYTRQIVWTDQTDFQPRKIDYYDRKDALLKTLTFADYQLYLDKHWRAQEFSMINHQTKKATILTWQNYEFKTGLTENDFDTNSLKRVR